jgi:hypothetical protein
MLPNATGRYPVIDPARLGRMLVLEDIDTDAIGPQSKRDRPAAGRDRQRSGTRFAAWL